ncbi:MAG: hypothetical protein ACLFVH_11845 [Phycisphaerae bacterium]
MAGKKRETPRLALSPSRVHRKIMAKARQSHDIDYLAARGIGSTRSSPGMRCWKEGAVGEEGRSDAGVATICVD